jgi:aminopeptidase N
MLCLHAVRSGDAVWPGRAYQRFKDAGNMTDRLGALAALVDAHSPLADAALAALPRPGRGDALVLDKWFALQAAPPSRWAHGRRAVFGTRRRCCSTPTSR